MVKHVRNKLNSPATWGAVMPLVVCVIVGAASAIQFAITVDKRLSIMESSVVCKEDIIGLRKDVEAIHQRLDGHLERSMEVMHQINEIFKSCCGNATSRIYPPLK